MRLSDSVKLYGICTDMCPEFERVRRIVEEDVKAPECTPDTEHLSRKQRIPDETRMVKAYSRSAAGAQQELVSDIRSPATCLKTIDYLYARLDHDDFDFLHQWLWDRTRAIRKDLRTQRIESKPDINILLTCLEQSARFLLLSTHHMARSTKDDYTHQQDIEQLNQTLMSLRERYVDNRRANIPSENEAEFWAYRLILAPIYTKTQLENELHRVPSDLRNNPRVKVAIEIFRALKSVIITSNKAIVQTQSNWKHFWDLLKSSRVSYLMACAAEISFNRMRHVVLDAIWRSYRQGTSKQPKSIDGWTPSRLRDVLGLDTDSEAVRHCEAYGFVFVRAEAGHTYMDFTQKGYQNHVLGMPSTDAELKPQIFSNSIVEAKRHHRALSAVIQGLSVEQARSRGLIMDRDSEKEMQDDTSLFVSETLSAQSSTPLIGTTKASHSDSTPTTSSFAFAQAPFEQKSAEASAIIGTQSGIFDAAKNTFQYPSNEGTAHGSAFQSTPTSSPITPGNLFPKPTASKKISLNEAGIASPIAPTNSFLNSSNTSKIPTVNPFASFCPPMTGASATTSLPEMKPAFTSAGFQFQKNHVQDTPQPPASLPSSFSTEPQADKERREVAQQAQRDADAQRKQAEARAAAQNALRQKRASEEAEHQRRQAEVAAQQQQAKKQREEQERRLKEEFERRMREAQRQKEQEEQARMSKLREKETAMNSLTQDVMFHPTEGLMIQFIENAALDIAHEAFIEVERQRNEAKGEELYRQYQLRLKRAGMAKIIAHLAKKKKNEQARERRKRLKAQRTQTKPILEENPLINNQGGLVTARRPSSRESILQRSALGQSSRRTKRTEERRGGQEQNSVYGLVSSKSSRPNWENGINTRSNGLKHSSILNNESESGFLTNSDKSSSTYSNAYQQSNAPIDRTETDWFALRAMGIDPSRHRKRSFDSTSTITGEQLKAEPKRTKLSPEDERAMPTLEQQLQPQSTSVIEDHRAQLRAIQDKLRKNASRERINGVQSVNGQSPLSSSIHGQSMRDRHSSDIIARARKLVASFSTAGSPVASVHDHMTHDFGRSVPNLGISASTYPAGSGLRASIAVLDRPNAPAYWQRTSRFVPRACYGKGPDAIREYREKWGLSPATSSTSDGPQRESGTELSGPSWQNAQQQQSEDVVSEMQESSQDFGFGYGFPPPETQHQHQHRHRHNQHLQTYTQYTDQNGNGTAGSAYPVDLGSPPDTMSQDEDEDEGNDAIYSSYLEQCCEEADSEVYDEDDEEEEDEDDEDDDEDDGSQDYAEQSDGIFGSGDEEEEQGQDENAFTEQRAMQMLGSTQDDAIELSD